MESPSDGLRGLPPSVAHFGKAFKSWRKQSGITQTDVDKITKALSLQGPYGSQVSRLETGQLIPQPFFFQSLSRFNQIVAQRETAKLQSKQKEKLQASHCLPYKTHDGRVAEASDFFLMYVGEQELSQAYKKENWTPESQSDVEVFNAFAMSIFQQLCAEMGVNTQQGWQQLTAYISDEQMKLEAPGLLFGFAPWDFDQATKWCELGQFCPLRLAFMEWTGKTLPPLALMIADFRAAAKQHDQTV